MSNQQVVDQLGPILSLCRELDLNDTKAAVARLDQEFPFHGAAIQKLRELCVRGVEQGWLCDRGQDPVRYSRVCKPDGNEQPFSCDAVLMEGPGPRHRHPKGEIDLCFSFDGEPSFDGNAPGWVVYHEDSRHTPTVTGGKMLILYMLPDAEIEWLR